MVGELAWHWVCWVVVFFFGGVFVVEASISVFGITKLLKAPFSLFCF